MAWLPALISPDGTIRRRMIRPRSLRFLHCTVFIADSYKQRSASLHFTRPGSSQEDIPKALVPAHRGFGIRGRSSSRWVLNGMAEDPQLARHFLGRGSSLCEDSPGLRRVRTSPRCSLDSANTDATKRYVHGLIYSS